MNENQSVHETGESFRRIIGKLAAFELEVLRRVLAKSGKRGDAELVIALDLIDSVLVAGHKTFLVDYMRRTVTAFFGCQEPTKACLNPKGKAGHQVYRRWYSAGDQVFFHADWISYKYIRCTMREFGLHLLSRFGKSHMSAHVFDYGFDLNRSEYVYPGNWLPPDPLNDQEVHRNRDSLREKGDSTC